MSISLQAVAELVGGTLVGDPEHKVSALASLDKALPHQITFLNSPKYRPALAECQAGVVMIREKDQAYAKGNVILVPDPYVAFALVAQRLDTTPACATGIAPSAVVADDAVLGEGVALGPNAVIESGVVLGDNVQIGANCYVGKGAKIGANSKLWANVSIYHGVEMGSDCLVQSGTVIGSDGFGYANDRGRWVKIPQLGRVIIGDRVEIGANTAIDRGAIDDTIIADGVIIDNLVQLGHNVEVGEGTCMAGTVAVAGSTKFGKHCIMGGGVGVNGHIDICDGAVVTGFSMVVKPITEPGLYSSGMPADHNKEWRRQIARINKLDDMYKRIEQLEAQLAQAGSESSDK